MFEVTAQNLDEVKRKLNVTWNEEGTEEKIRDMIEAADKELTEVFGCDLDFSESGMHKTLFLELVLYKWNDMTNDFYRAYQNMINMAKRKLRVAYETEKDNI